MKRGVRYKHRGQHRRAVVLIAALVCLAIVMALIGGMLLAALRTSRQLRAERDMRQCQLMLTAGIDRATHQIASSADYRGETWRLSADQISGRAAGEVTIEIVSDPQANPRQLRIVAEYPLGEHPPGNETSIRRSQTISIPITKR